jgi:3-hydroxyisobutyrate dehydrogenase-like beta-hydroxyacid dehydrogenase
MEKPTKIVVDCLTGIAETTEMTDEELAEHEANIADSPSLSFE